MSWFSHFSLAFNPINSDFSLRTPVISTSLNLIDLFRVSFHCTSEQHVMPLFTLSLKPSLTMAAFLTSTSAPCQRSSGRLDRSSLHYPPYLWSHMHVHIFNSRPLVVNFSHLYIQVKVIKCLLNSTNRMSPKWTKKSHSQAQFVTSSDSKPDHLQHLHFRACHIDLSRHLLPLHLP